MADSITDVLDQWTSSAKKIAIFSVIGQQYEDFNKTLDIARLDGYWPYTYAPSGNSIVDIFDGGDGCTDDLYTTHKSTYYYLLITAENNCIYERAAERVQMYSKAGGVIIVTREAASTLVEVNKNSLTALDHIRITSISYADGQTLKKMIATSINERLTIGFYSETIPGYILIVDSKKEIQQLGMNRGASLMLASWAAQYENYKETLYFNLSQPALVVPIIDEKRMPADSVPVTLPKEISSFGSLSIDTSITCPGFYDADCSEWDHTVSISISCANTDSSEINIFEFSPSNRKLEVGGGAFEIARYETPFSRHVGRWLTDITPLIPLLSASECQSFVFNAVVGAQQWIISSNLRFTDWLKDAPKNYSSLYSFSHYFNTAYNDDRELLISIPDRDLIRRVELEAIVTTHGYDDMSCCEFLPTAHISTINGQEFNLTFDSAGTPWGCSDRVVEGSEPNEFGTWWYGRGGWCDGMNVHPWVVDVTDAALRNDLSQTNEENMAANITIYYRALMFSFKNNTWIPPRLDSSSGYVIMSSNVIYYYHNTSLSASSSDYIHSDPYYKADSSAAMILRRELIIIIVLAGSLFFVCFLAVYLICKRKEPKISYRSLALQQQSEEMTGGHSI
jgi:hypothetical protein